MYVWDDRWLAQVREEIVDPALPIIDPHHHLWEREGMTRYLLHDLHADTGLGPEPHHNVIGTVFVDCMWGYRSDGPEHLRPVGESSTVAADAARSRAIVRADGTPAADIRGIVSFADMTLGGRVDEVLAAHESAGAGLFRGIRHATALVDDPGVRRSHTRPTPGLMAEPSFRAGVARLAARGHSFDAWLFHPQIRELTALAQAVPECTFVLDHLGGLLGIASFAGRRDEILAAWRDDIAELAACPNVVVKVGGIGMTIYGLGFESRALPPTSDELVAAWGGPIRYVIERFGASRCMFESNFPVDKMSCSYHVLWNAFKKMTADASADERTALFSGTATRTYRL
jgi:L-fuconolactonase